MRRTIEKSGSEFRLDGSLFREIAESVFDVVLRVRRGGEVVYSCFNEHGRSLAGCGAGQDGHIRDALGALFTGETEGQFNEVFEQGGVSVVDVPCRGNGDGHICQVRMSVCGRDEALVLIRDVTGERRTAAAVESQDRLINIIENMPAMMVAFDDSGRMAAWNRECERVTGFTKNEMLQHSDGLAKLFPDAKHRREMEKYFVDQDSPFRDMELGLRCRDGSMRTISWSNVSRDFPVPGWRSWAVGLDVTERLQDRQRLERLFLSLREKNEELESLAHITSHDLRSPFVNVKGFSGELSRMCRQLRELLAGLELSDEKRERLEVLLNEDIPEALYFIDSGVSRMDHLLEGLAKLSRIGRVEMMVEELDVHRIVDESLSTMRYMIDQKGIEVEIGQMCPARGDASQILQVFSNLIKNAVHYMDSSRQGRIRVSGRVQGDESVFCIEDNGIGIRVESQKEIFELFKRLAPDGQIEGEGLGLAIVKRIISKHNGRVWVESEPGHGSKFFFTLPLGNGD